MVGDQASPLVGAVVNGVAVVVRLASADRIAQLPESVAGHARGGNGGDLPWSLDRAVVGWRAVCYLKIRISRFHLFFFFFIGFLYVACDSHSSKKQGLFAATQAFAWSATHLAPVSYPTLPGICQ